MLSTYLGNKLLDHALGKTSFTMPAAVYVALLKIRAQSNNLRSTAVSVGDFTIPGDAQRAAVPLHDRGNDRIGRAELVDHGRRHHCGRRNRGLDRAHALAALGHQRARMRLHRLCAGVGAVAVRRGGVAELVEQQRGQVPQEDRRHRRSGRGFATYDASSAGNLLEFGLNTGSPVTKTIQDNDYAAVRYRAR
jgi:hypothetical protein